MYAQPRQPLAPFARPSGGLHLWLALLLLLPGAAHPGPWPRKPGEALLISTVETSYHLSHWGEYGLSPTRWLTLELDFPRSGGRMEAALSLNHSLPDWRGWKSALSFGAALRSLDPLKHSFDPEGALQIGGAAGRSFTAPLSGWMSFSSRYREGQDFAWVKTEATLGLKPIERLSLIGQLQFSAERDALRSLRVQASGVWQFTPKLGLELGFTRELWGDSRGTTGRIGSWVKF